MSGSGFRGVSAAQDSRFGDKEKKLLKSTKFPESFNTRCDLSKVQVGQRGLASRSSYFPLPRAQMRCGDE